MDHNQEYLDMTGLESAHYPMMQYPAAQLESMYPGCYHIINPRVKKMCDMMVYQNPSILTNPNPATIQQMTDSVYDEVEPLLGEQDMSEVNYPMAPGTGQMMPVSDDLYGSGQYGMYGDEGMRQFGMGFGAFPGFGFFPRPRRRFLRDLIGILLIRNLLRRRRPFFGF